MECPVSALLASPPLWLPLDPENAETGWRHQDLGLKFIEERGYAGCRSDLRTLAACIVGALCRCCGHRHGLLAWNSRRPGRLTRPSCSRSLAHPPGFGLSPCRSQGLSLNRWQGRREHFDEIRAALEFGCAALGPAEQLALGRRAPSGGKRVGNPLIGPSASQLRDDEFLMGFVLVHGHLMLSFSVRTNRQQNKYIRGTKLERSLRTSRCRSKIVPAVYPTRQNAVAAGQGAAHAVRICVMGMPGMGMPGEAEASCRALRSPLREVTAGDLAKQLDLALPWLAAANAPSRTNTVLLESIAQAVGQQGGGR